MNNNLEHLFTLLLNDSVMVYECPNYSSTNLSLYENGTLSYITETLYIDSYDLNLPKRRQAAGKHSFVFCGAK